MLFANNLTLNNSPMSIVSLAFLKNIVMRQDINQKNQFKHLSNRQTKK